MPNQLVRTPDGRLAVFNVNEEDFIHWSVAPAKVKALRQQFFAAYDPALYGLMVAQALDDEPFRGEKRPVHRELLGRFEGSVLAIGLAHGLTHLETRLESMRLSIASVPSSIVAAIDEAAGPVRPRRFSRSALAPLEEPVVMPQPRIVVRPEDVPHSQLEEVASRAASWWGERLMQGDRGKFEEHLRVGVLNDLQTEGLSKMRVDHDPQGIILDAVRAAGLECKGYMFSAEGILPTKRFLTAFPDRIEGWEVTRRVEIEIGKD